MKTYVGWVCMLATASVLAGPWVVGANAQDPAKRVKWEYAQLFLVEIDSRNAAMSKANGRWWSFFGSGVNAREKELEELAKKVGLKNAEKLKDGGHLALLNALGDEGWEVISISELGLPTPEEALKYREKPELKSERRELVKVWLKRQK